jgi:hypothetical protein
MIALKTALHEALKVAQAVALVSALGFIAYSAVTTATGVAGAVAETYADMPHLFPVKVTIERQSK